MLSPVVPLLRGRQNEHRPADDAGRIAAVGRHAVFQVGTQIDDPVIGADLARGGSPRNHQRIAVGAHLRGQKSALAADHGGFQIAIRLCEPLAPGQQAEHLEQDGRSVPHARHQRPPFARTVPDPDAHGVVGRRPDGPCVAVAVARPGLPADLLRRGEILPLALLLGARDAADRLEHQPQRTPREGNVAGRNGLGRRRVVVRPADRLLPAEFGRHQHIGGREVPQRDLRAAQDQRQPVMVGAAVDRAETQPPHQRQKILPAVFVEHPHRRDVERTLDHPVGGNRAVERAVVVLRREIPVIGRHVGEKHRRKRRAVVEHPGVEDRFEHAAAAAPRGDDVDAGSRTPVPGVVDVAGIGQRLPAPHVHHHDGQVVDPVAPVLRVVTPRQGVHPPLKVGVERRAQRPRAHLAQQVHRLHRHRFGSFGQRFQLGQGARQGVDVPAAPDAVEQPVALLAQPFAVALHVDQRRRVGQHGEQGAFGPRKVPRAAAEIVPRSALQPHDIAAEGRMGGIQGQGLLLTAPHFEPQRQHRFDELFAKGPGLPAAAQTDGLHRERAGAALDPPRREVLPHGARQRQRIDSEMTVETLVLVGRDCGAELPGHAVRRKEPPLPVGGDLRRKKPPVAAPHRRGERLVEERPRQGEEKARGEQQGKPDREEADSFFRHHF